MTLVQNFQSHDIFRTNGEKYIWQQNELFLQRICIPTLSVLKFQ